MLKDNITPAQINLMGSIIADIRERSADDMYLMPREEEMTYDSILYAFDDLLDADDTPADIRAAVLNNF